MNRLFVSKCPQCSAGLIPAFAGMIWSERRSDRSVRNVWSCEACAYQFEHTVYFCSRARHGPYSEAIMSGGRSSFA
jgi:ribosomal protein L37AE/L43A